MKLINLFIIGVFMFLLTPFVAGASFWTTDPTTCPSSDGTNFPGQNCAPQDICGDSSGTAQCYDTSTISAPGTTATSNSNYDSSTDGGYVLNCYATADSSAPFCDNSGNFWCDRKADCYSTKHVNTICSAGSFGVATCSSTCRSGYFACDGSTADADGCEIQSGVSCGSGTGTIVNNQCFSSTVGNCTSSTNLDCDNDDSDSNTATCNGANGCEITPGSACTVGSLSGTYSNSCSGGAGVCVVSKSYFETGTNTQYQTNSTQHFLWGTDYGSVGDLLRLNNTNFGIFSINASGCIIWMDGTSTCSAPTSGGGSDGNASSICADGQYLDGSGACIDFNSTVSDIGVNSGFNSTFNSTYNSKADYQFTNNNFNGSGNFNTTGRVMGVNQTMFDKLIINYNSWITNAVSDLVNYFTKTEVTSMINGNVSDLRTDINSNWTDLENRKLNITDQRYNETDWVNSQGFITTVSDDSVIIKYQNISNLPTCSGTDKLTFDGTTLTCATDNGGTDTQKTTNGNYLYNDSTTISFNETKLNQTIDSRDSDTTYTNGTGLILVGTKFNLSVTYTDGRYVSRTDWTTNDNYPTNCNVGDFVTGIGDTLSCTTPSYTTDTNETTRFGNLVGTDCSTGQLVIGVQSDGTVLCATDSDTTYTNGSGISIVGTQINHSDTSSQASSDNSGRTYIQDILLDEFGHVTSITTATETITDTDTQKTTNAQPLYNDSTSIYFNNTFNNDTIDNRISLNPQGFITTVSDDSVIIKYQNISNLPTCSGNQRLYFDGTTLYCSDVNTFNSTYNSKADYQFTNNNFNGSGNFNTTGRVMGVNQTMFDKLIINYNSWITNAVSDLVNYFTKTEVTSMINGNVSDLRTDINSNWTDLENRKLNITDQRYNETDKINAVNTTANIEGLGFVQGPHTVDTNETTRFNALTGTDCPSGQLVIGVQNDGTVLCATDTTGGGGTNYYPTSINFTANTYNGSLINGTKTGYSAGNSICNAEFSGHMCDESEVTQWFANAGTGLDGDAWVTAGGPKFVPASVPVNDCNGWTHGSAGTYLGNYWHFNSTTGGDPRAINCATKLVLCCAVY